MDRNDNGEVTSWRNQQYADFGEEGTICVLQRVQTVQLWKETRTAKSECRRYPYYVVKKVISEVITNLKDQDKLVSAWYKDVEIVDFVESYW